MIMKKNGILDIFCGPGGLSLGFTFADFNIVYSTDIDESPIKTIRSNQSKINHAKKIENFHQAKVSDIKDINPEEIQNLFKQKGFRIHGIIGGPPCRGFSKANTKTRTPDNPYNSLYKYYLELIEELKPEFFVFENVIGFVSSIKGKNFEDIKIKLQGSLGYTIKKFTLNAFDFGVPQIRYRIIIIGIKQDKLKPEFNGIIPEIEKKPQIIVSVDDALSDLPEVQPGCIQEIYEYPKRINISHYAESMRASSKFGISSTLVQNHSTTKNNALVLERYKYIKQGENWKNLPDYLLANYNDKTRCHSGIYRRLKPDDPSPTVNNVRKSMFIHPWQDRGLTVREAARLQSFPDWYEFKGKRESQYQQVADAVPPLMAKAIAEHIRGIMID